MRALRLLCGFLLLPVLASADITSNLYAHWDFNGSPYLNDVFSTHHLTDHSTKQTWGKGVEGNALQLNFNNIYTNPASHSTSNNAYADISGIHGAISGSYTIAAFVYPTMLPPGSAPANDWAYAIAGWSNGAHGNILLMDNAGHFQMVHEIASGPTRYTATSSTTQTTRRWYHVAGVVDKGAGTVKIYVDGNLRATETFTANEAVYDHSSSNFYVGIVAPGASNYRGAFAGRIDDLRLYQRALSQSDVFELMRITSVDPGPGDDDYASAAYTVKVGNSDGTTFTETYTYAASRESVVANWHNGDSPVVHWANAFSTGGVVWEVELNGTDITTADVTPHSAHPHFIITGSPAKLYIVADRQLSKLWVTVNGDTANPLFLFVNPPFTCPEGATGATTEPGIYTLGTYVADDDEVICLNPGVMLRGNIDARGKDNVRILGPGAIIYDTVAGEYISGLTYEQSKDYWAITAEGSTNLTVDGPVLVNYPSYGIREAETINNVKALSPWYWSTDAFYGVTITETLAFVGDSVAPPWANYHCTTDTYTVNMIAGTTNNSVFNNYKGSPGGVAPYPNCQAYTGWIENIDVVATHTSGDVGQSVLADFWIDNPCSSGTSDWGFSNMLFNGIRVEGSNATGPFLSVRHKDYPWDGVTGAQCGNGDNFWFRDIVAEGAMEKAEFLGKDSANTITGIHWQGVYINSTHVNTGNFGTYVDTNAYVTFDSID